ncbi:putative ABC transporter permease [Paenibacillus wynnii]|uniref:putative ABC transporter permease n=1 Tax=Paenibacillus wynnii TaxID=268407 RepID=UPI000AC93602|nr:putative ABC transporter permease [Paenibacillus wynnii]
MTILPIFSLDGYTHVTGAQQYFFYFIIYSFLGWVLEGTYNLYSNGSFRKEGFMKGPFKPMYGFAPLFLLLARDLALPLPVFLLLALIIPSAVEFISGWLLKTLFHRQWWDYSGLRYHLQGHICLRFSLYWWVLCIACIYGIQPLMEFLYQRVEPLWELLLPPVAFFFTADLLWTSWTRRRGGKKLELGES